MEDSSCFWIYFKVVLSQNALQKIFDLSFLWFLAYQNTRLASANTMGKVFNIQVMASQQQTNLNTTVLKKSWVSDDRISK